jgi:hypothetical protein
LEDPLVCKCLLWPSQSFLGSPLLCVLHDPP